MKLQMNHLHLIAASKDLIFVFSLRDLSLITRINVPQHLLRITMSSLPPHSLNQSLAEYSTLAFSGLFNSGSINFHHIPLKFKSDNLAVSTSPN
jgi:hypothetical protein